MNTKKNYPPVNKCIYCGATDKKLTDEHIIAYGLNGGSVLPKSSCLDCNKITSRIERNVMRGFAWQMRTALGFPTRRPKDVPKTFKLGVVKNGVETVIDVPLTEHFIVLPLPLFNLPVYFESRFLKKEIDYKEGIGLAAVQVIWFSDMEKIAQLHNADEISVLHELDHISFALMIAKIAYSLVVAVYGLEFIQEAFVLPAIRGEQNDIGKWVGSSNQVFEAVPNSEHQTRIEVYEYPDPNNPDGIIIAHIRLFANRPSPLYTVLVGRPKKEKGKDISSQPG